MLTNKCRKNKIKKITTWQPLISNDSGKNYQWVLKLVGHFLMRNKMFMYLQHTC